MPFSFPATSTAAAIVAAVLCSTVWSAAIVNAESRTHIVEIRKLEFSPAALNVDSGDTIVWINRDLVPHTVTADDKSWDSPTLNTGDEWLTVVRDGMHERYFCRFHPLMKAQLQIEPERN